MLSIDIFMCTTSGQKAGTSKLIHLGHGSCKWWIGWVLCYKVINKTIYTKLQKSYKQNNLDKIAKIVGVVSIFFLGFSSNFDFFFGLVVILS